MPAHPKPLLCGVPVTLCVVLYVNIVPFCHALQILYIYILLYFPVINKMGVLVSFSVLLLLCWTICEVFIQVGEEVSEEGRSCEHQSSGQPVLHSEGVPEVENGEEQADKLPQSDDQRHHQ